MADKDLLPHDKYATTHKDMGAGFTHHVDTFDNPNLSSVCKCRMETPNTPPVDSKGAGKGSKAKLYMPAETLEDLLKGMDGMDVRYNEPLDLIWRLANILQRDLRDIRFEHLEHLQDDHGVRISAPRKANK